MSALFEKWKGMDGGKKIRVLTIIIIVAVIIALYTSTIAPQTSQISTDPGAGMEARFAQILSSVEGAGKVEVIINYASTSEKVPAMLTQSSSQTRSDGGNTTQNSSQESQEVAKSGQEAFILKENLPEVQGVVIVAQGAGNPAVRIALTDAAKTLFSLDLSKITVLKMTK